MSGTVAARHRAPGLRPDQRDDRHHRGGEEPHAAGRRSPPRRRSRASNFYVDQDGAGRGGRCRRRARITSAETAVGRGRRRCRHGACTSAAPWCSTCRCDVQAAAAAAGTTRRSRSIGRGVRCRRPSDRGRATGSSAALRRARRPVFVAGRGARGTGGRARAGARSPTLRGAAGDLGRRQGPVPRQPVVAGRLRRLRLAAGRRADRRRRPDRRLGLRPQHVDDAPRPADRPRRHGRPGRRRPRGARRPPRADLRRASATCGVDGAVGRCRPAATAERTRRGYRSDRRCADAARRRDAAGGDVPYERRQRRPG